jgi:fatty acid desaturase
MNNIKHNISSILSWISLTITVLVLLITGFSLVSSNRAFFRNEGLDVVIFILMWFYIIFLPIVCGLALIVGDRLRTLIRGNFISLAIWIIFIIWTLTMTL